MLVILVKEKVFKILILCSSESFLRNMWQKSDFSACEDTFDWCTGQNSARRDGNARAKLYFLKADGSSWSLASLKAREHIKADGQWASFIHCWRIKAPGIPDNLFYNCWIPRSMKMWTSMQLKPLRPHNAVIGFI